jgi:catechol 2,3-dioxygenase-like lactoylglutathione lyase family enzyme
LTPEAEVNAPAMMMRYTGAVLDAPDARELADFYRRLLGWEVAEDSPHWVMLRSPDGTARLSFQHEPHYRRPVWPGTEGDQLMMAHLDIEVDDLTTETDRAIAEGAELADHQPQELVRVCLDPAGHPFCLWVRETDEGL